MSTFSSAPNLTFSVNSHKISNVSGYDYITVTFSSDIPYTSFECRATKVGEDWGIGKGALITSFSNTPADTERTFEIYDDYLANGDGEYRISLFATGEDGNVNDNEPYVLSGDKYYITSDGKKFLCRR